MTFDEIYAAYYKNLVRRARRLLPVPDPHISIQLASDAFLELNHALQRGKPIPQPEGYLRWMLGCKIKDWLRQYYSPRKLTLEELDPEYMISSAMAPNNLLALREQLDNALSQLKPVEQQAIQLCYVNGHTYREAAAVQQVPVSTFEKRLLSAVHKVRRHFQKGDASCCELTPCTTSPSPLTMATN